MDGDKECCFWSTTAAQTVVIFFYVSILFFLLCFFSPWSLFCATETRVLRNEIIHDPPFLCLSLTIIPYLTQPASLCLTVYPSAAPLASHLVMIALALFVAVPVCAPDQSALFPTLIAPLSLSMLARERVEGHSIHRLPRTQTHAKKGCVRGQAVCLPACVHVCVRECVRK